MVFNIRNYNINKNFKLLFFKNNKIEPFMSLDILSFYL